MVGTYAPLVVAGRLGTQDLLSSGWPGWGGVLRRRIKLVHRVQHILYPAISAFSFLSKKSRKAEAFSRLISIKK
jgi:hypothetical protein